MKEQTITDLAQELATEARIRAQVLSSPITSRLLEETHRALTEAIPIRLLPLRPYSIFVNSAPPHYHSAEAHYLAGSIHYEAVLDLLTLPQPPWVRLESFVEDTRIILRWQTQIAYVTAIARAYAWIPAEDIQLLCDLGKAHEHTFTSITC